MDENKQAKLLLEKYLRGECTSEEEDQVQAWFYSFDEEYLEEGHLKVALQQVKEGIMGCIDTRPIVASTARLFPWLKIAVAVLVFIVFGGIMVLYLNKDKEGVTTELAAIVIDSTGIHRNDIMPGAASACVIYANGKRKEIIQNELVLMESEGSTSELLTIEVPKAGKYRLDLEDGTVVWMNSLSTLSFPERFGHEERRVELNGEAYFEVTKDNKRPFRITVKGSTIEVLGTSFNVNAYSDTISTSLVEGKVKIIKEQAERFLLPGEEALIRGSEINISQTNLLKNTAWQRDEFYFDGSNLRDIIEQVARWYNVDFVNSELLTESSTYKGAIGRGHKLSEVLGVLTAATQRKFEINGREVTVR
ncbi:FecR family protein [Sphingobacterium sp. SYP-B4668]|uniref:FecR family protein n=1 Tax=Sphingobacterium sp. SYP-B4668 TaxID=2996035 RepID=UPI0022DDAEF7|nr:FecR family protein [Sphingobacterium sp. SYP-B4668]